MKKVLLLAVGYKKAITTLTMISTFIMTTVAQNTSFDENTLSIAGFNNAAFGIGALEVNSSDFNTAAGFNALLSNTAGSRNTASGALALKNNTGGVLNTANGYNALLSNKTGGINTALGTYALFSNIIGNNNVAVGDSAGYNSLGSSNIFLGKRAGYYEAGSNKLYIGSDSNKTILFGDLSTGQLLLGNKQPAGYAFKGKRTLNVIGGVLADSVRVSLSSQWADYVFADNYQLKPLNELESFIKINKHLPNIPAAEDVAINGIELGTINTKLLEKIEELTLYIIQQQKQIQEQQAINEHLKKNAEKSKESYELLQLQIDELKKILQTK